VVASLAEEEADLLEALGESVSARHFGARLWFAGEESVSQLALPGGRKGRGCELDFECERSSNDLLSMADVQQYPRIGLPTQKWSFFALHKLNGGLHNSA